MAESYLSRLERMLVPLGVKIVTTCPWSEGEDSNPPSGWSACPFDEAAVHYQKRVVFVSKKRASHFFGTLIHESGHVVASSLPPEPSDEGSWLWWELAMAYVLGRDRGVRLWKKDSNDYVLSDGGTVKNVEPRILIRYAKKSVAHGKKRGFLDAQGHPCRMGRE